MLIIVVLCLSLIAQNLWENALFIRHKDLTWKKFLAAYGYSVRPVILVLFLFIILPDGRKWPQWLLVGINAALYFSSPYTKLCFEIRDFDFEIADLYLAALSGNEKKRAAHPGFHRAEHHCFRCDRRAYAHGIAIRFLPDYCHCGGQRVLLYLAASAICAGTRAGSDGRPANPDHDDADPAPL